MIIVAEQAGTGVERIRASAASEYQIGDRVLYKVLVNQPRHLMPDEKVEATVIHSFPNGKWGFTYRLRLDRVWLPEAGELFAGKPIIVGNVSGGQLRPLS